MSSSATAPSVIQKIGHLIFFSQSSFTGQVQVREFGRTFVHGSGFRKVTAEGNALIFSHFESAGEMDKAFARLRERTSLALNNFSRGKKGWRAEEWGIVAEK